MRSLFCLPLLLLGCGAVLDEPAESMGVQGEYRVALGGAACPRESPDAAAARGEIARVRALAGLAPLRCDANAAAAARGHCGYVTANQELTHVQRRAGKRFTGVTFAERLASAAFAESPAGEVLANLQGAEAISGASGFLNSVYHRAFFLRSETTSFGYGSEGTCATIDFGRARPEGPDVTVLWPPDGARNVPFEFWSSRESPNPLPGTLVVGSPVTFTRPRAFGSVTATLTGPHGAIDGVLLHHQNDPHSLVRPGEAHFVPRAPLAPNTTYRARFVIDGAELVSTFTTAAK